MALCQFHIVCPQPPRGPKSVPSSASPMSPAGHSCFPPTRFTPPRLQLRHPQALPGPSGAAGPGTARLWALPGDTGAGSPAGPRDHPGAAPWAEGRKEAYHDQRPPPRPPGAGHAPGPVRSRGCPKAAPVPEEPPPACREPPAAPGLRASATRRPAGRPGPAPAAGPAPRAPPRGPRAAAPGRSPLTEHRRRREAAEGRRGPAWPEGAVTARGGAGRCQRARRRCRLPCGPVPVARPVLPGARRAAAAAAPWPG
ncbi:basic proline-rich protein-like [Vidua macroura]|uniref:basic proline-rich protein-like n=1 Tax=Vidua macroura TaxID=187451 RepID=UPI0023A83328|nr:basic proline-rich protein-like [Vidua macroura]